MDCTGLVTNWTSGLYWTVYVLSGNDWTVVMSVASGHNPTNGYIVGIGILNQR